MKKLLSLQSLTQGLQQCTRRFPLSVCFIALLTIFLLVRSWGNDDWFTKRQTFILIYYFSVGTLLTLVLQLWGEENRNKHIRISINTATHLLLVLDTLYLYFLPDNTIFLETALAHSSAITALWLCMSILPFLKEKDDVASWNFTLRLITIGATSWIIGTIMCAGLALLTTSFDILFDINVSEKWYLTWGILCGFTLPALLFLGRIPNGETKHDRIPYSSPFLTRVVRSLFIPLLGCYLAVLYVYALKIVIQWQLPNGWVSWLVTYLTFGCIGVELCLYPSLRQGASRFDRLVSRHLPLAILPLLVLMTVGIGRRLADYGITINRLYLLTLNVWYYIVCGGLVITRVRRVNWIALSFAGLFILTSLLPFNIVSITRNHLWQEINTTVNRTYKGQLPMSQAQYEKWMLKLPAEEALQTNSRLEYLEWTLDEKKEIKQLIKDDVSYYSIEDRIQTAAGLNDKKADAVEVDAIDSYRSAHAKGVAKIDFAINYKSILVINEQNDTIPRPANSKGGILRIPLSDRDRVIDTLTVSIDSILQWDKTDKFTPTEIPTHQEHSRFVLIDFQYGPVSKKDSVYFNFSGYYLTAKK